MATTKTSKPPRDYTQDDRDAVLAMLDACNGNLTDCAKNSGVPITTISQWRDKAENGADEQFGRTENVKRKPLADIFEQIAYRACELAVDKIDQASFAQTMTGAGIAVDKMRLLREQPTNIVEANVPKTIAERDQEAISIIERTKLKMLRERYADGVLVERDHEGIIEGIIEEPAP